MENIIPIEAIEERDIDLLLLEEFYCSREFQKWFIKNTVSDTFPYRDFGGAWHSINHEALGESDLIVKFLKPNKKGYLFIVENKIDAFFQPQQPLRYKKRGDNYIKKGECEDYATVLVAPSEYASGNTEFDFVIEYEEIRDWFLKKADLKERGRYKAEVLNAALERYRRGYQSVGHQATSIFWRRYWEVVSRIAPELRMNKPRHNVPIRSSFIFFKPDNLKDGFKLCHKAAHGFVDLQFTGKGNEVGQLIRHYKPFLKKGRTIIKTNKSAVVRVGVGKLNLQGDFKQQKKKVIAAIETVKELNHWAQKTVF